MLQSIAVSANARKLLRSFPYAGLLFPFLPFLVDLGETRELPWFASLQLIPFVLAIAAGFMYNAVCDAPYDSPIKNPISEGVFRKETVTKLAVLLAVASVIAFLPFAKSSFSIPALILYIALWFAYSGVGIRLKETLAGPFVASWVVWCGGPAVFLINYSVKERHLLLLWGSLFLFYVANEINHQLGDYKEDLARSVKTFSVRVGLLPAILLRYSLIVASMVLFSSSISILLNLSFPKFLLTTISLLLFFALFEVLLYPDILVRFVRTRSLKDSIQDFKRTSRASPFVVMKPLLIIFLIIRTGLGIWTGLTMLWILASNKRT